MKYLRLGDTLRNCFPGREFPKLEDEHQLEKLVERFRAGETSLREQLVNLHLELTVATVIKYSDRVYATQEDSLSYALEVLVDTVDSFPNVAKDNDITSYIMYILRRRLRRYKMQRHFSVTVPDNSQKKKRAQLTIFHVKHRVDASKTEPYNLPEALRDTKSREHREIFNKACYTDKERRVLDDLLAGYSFGEMLIRLSIKEGSLRVTIEKIKNRIRAFYNLLEE